MEIADSNVWGYLTYYWTQLLLNILNVTFQCCQQPEQKSFHLHYVVVEAETS